MTTTAASTLTVGTHVRVSTRLAAYHSRPDLAGTVRPVVGLRVYSPSCIGVTLEGMPETCSLPGASVEVVL